MTTVLDDHPDLREVTNPERWAHYSSGRDELTADRANQRPHRGLCGYSRVPLDPDAVRRLPVCPFCDRMIAVRRLADGWWST